ncbi:deoxynucleoside kinase [Serpentinicella sp. ANB-PHB4]|uniref:deoxynucleoside kinase n=1 Tax=Serpentinicella sp. ANB-PHB4 TaxID=3074076 RepID=UPI00285F8CD3|nr:deoxynucleoside kinase [Serpentinicella sp. ANB-PHB4]MDR5659060.1 deoxynucleoside kinase [Serpentinicella sp. ANB-PHB4]
MLTKLIVPNKLEPKERKNGDGYFITISGNVGAGKSTFTEIMGNALEFNTSFEKVVGNPYLSDFYEDQSRWSFHLQLYFLSQRFQDQKRIGELNQNHIQDRSIYEDVEIFAKSLHDNKKMSDRDFDTYSELFYCMMTPYLVKPDLMIFLDGSIDTILKRINQRGREMEQKIPNDYWIDLHNRYKNWIKNYTHSPVLVIDIDKVDLIEKPEQVEIITKEIKKILK